MVDVRESVGCESGCKSPGSDSGERVAGAMIIEGAEGCGGSSTDEEVASFDDDDCSLWGVEVKGIGVELPLPRMALAVEVVVRAAPSVLKGGGAGKEDCLEAGEGDRLRLNREPRLTCSESLLRCARSEEEAGADDDKSIEWGLAEDDDPATELEPLATGSDVPSSVVSVLACASAFFFSSASFRC